jgi:bifunctional DNA-binding transcriptional regulator/antitoxin component of YhaV-PrlF toxin-antitoxin module
MESENRKLIKFSNYSLCVTLPKSVIRNLGWEKGNVVKMIVDEKKGEILIKKGNGKEKENIEKSSTIDIKKPASKKKSRW